MSSARLTTSYLEKCSHVFNGILANEQISAYFSVSLPERSVAIPPALGRSAKFLI